MLPDTDAFVYLNVENPFVAWAAYRGILVTPPTEHQGLVSIWYADLLRQIGSGHWVTEMDLEGLRRDKFPDRNSRLAGFFCFPDINSAKVAPLLWNSGAKSYFKLENLAEINLSEARGHDILDSNWITYSRGANLDPGEWMESYWLGRPYPREEPVWETIVEGRATVLGTELRTQAYDVVKARWPGSLAILELSRLAALAGSDLGSIHAFLSDSGNHYSLDYYMNLEELDKPEFDSSILELIDSGHPVNWEDIRPWRDQNSYGKLPDMRPFSLKLPK